MKNIAFTAFILLTFGSLLFAQETEEYDTPPELIGVSEIVVTPENGIRPANYTDLDVTVPLFRLEPIENPPYGSLKFYPEDGFAEGYMNLKHILARAFELPGYRVYGDKNILSEIYEFAFVHLHEETFYEECRARIDQTLPFLLTHKKQNVVAYNLVRISDEGIIIPDSSRNGRIISDNEEIEGVSVTLKQLANWIEFVHGVEIITDTSDQAEFGMALSSQAARDFDTLSEELEKRVGLSLVPFEKEAWVLFVE